MAAVFDGHIQLQPAPTLPIRIAVPSTTGAVPRSMTIPDIASELTYYGDAEIISRRDFENRAAGTEYCQCVLPFGGHRSTCRHLVNSVNSGRERTADVAKAGLAAIRTLARDNQNLAYDNRVLTERLRDAMVAAAPQARAYHDVKDYCGKLEREIKVLQHNQTAMALHMNTQAALLTEALRQLASPGAAASTNAILNQLTTIHTTFPADTGTPTLTIGHPPPQLLTTVAHSAPAAATPLQLQMAGVPINQPLTGIPASSAPN